ncbi:hypothetical protein GALMADRAFT_250106 [Galerina marginata CBS 339.88]|uniref:Uncharacterized protein n=1 Tax=Galerina marginata (strain CBS 339.88) TaxID=685588 RepID=A0A067T2Y1_GALM3|nr:hypothetical protein GALMADRAFT_250106 [Galerina marginata CBS 339.88]
MMTQWLSNPDGLEAIVSALKKLKEKGAVRYPGGVELLDWTIGISENGFEQEKSAEGAWNILFSA